MVNFRFVCSKLLHKTPFTTFIRPHPTPSPSKKTIKRLHHSSEKSSNEVLNPPTVCTSRIHFAAHQRHVARCVSDYVRACTHTHRSMMLITSTTSQSPREGRYQLKANRKQVGGDDSRTENDGRGTRITDHAREAASCASNSLPPHTNPHPTPKQ